MEYSRAYWYGLVVFGAGVHITLRDTSPHAPTVEEPISIRDAITWGQKGKRAATITKVKKRWTADGGEGLFHRVLNGARERKEVRFAVV